MFCLPTPCVHISFFLLCLRTSCSVCQSPDLYKSLFYCLSASCFFLTLSCLPVSFVVCQQVIIFANIVCQAIFTSLLFCRATCSCLSTFSLSPYVLAVLHIYSYCGEPAISLHSHHVSLVQWTTCLLPVTRDPGSNPQGGTYVKPGFSC